MSLSIDNGTKSSLGWRRREERERLGYNQADFAGFVGKDKKTQLRWEKGDSSPSLAEVGIWLKKGLDVGYLLTGVKTDNGSKMSSLDALQLAVDVLRKLDMQNLDQEQVNTIVSWAWMYNMNSDMLAKFIRSAYIVAGVPLPKSINNGDKQHD